MRSSSSPLPSLSSSPFSQLTASSGINHGTFLHIAHEEVRLPRPPSPPFSPFTSQPPPSNPRVQGLILNTSIHAGIRAPLVRRKGDMRNDKRCGFALITARDLDALGTAGVVAKIKQRVGSSRVYVSVDVDVMDPAYAPATGTAEPGGWTSRELLTILDGLRGLQVVGGDVVEVAPVYDNPGETTVLVAAEVGRSLIALMVGKPVGGVADGE